MGVVALGIIQRPLVLHPVARAGVLGRFGGVREVARKCPVGLELRAFVAKERCVKGVPGGEKQREIRRHGKETGQYIWRRVESGEKKERVGETPKTVDEYRSEMKPKLFLPTSMHPSQWGATHALSP